VFAALDRLQAGALVIGPDSLFAAAGLDQRFDLRAVEVRAHHPHAFAVASPLWCDGIVEQAVAAAMTQQTITQDERTFITIGPNVCARVGRNRSVDGSRS
jgi:hypothetical protein